nr:glutaredoxin family protein [uncultured Glaciecola sp.]
MKLILYTGPNCSLCDLAIDIIDKFSVLNAETTNESTFQHSPSGSQLERVELEMINIRDSAGLYHLYASRIPVLKKTDDESELGWPFTLEDVIEFL